jgi:hypothetical protein
MGLRAVAPDLWTAEHPMRFPGGVHLPSRMTVARLPDGDLWVHSPIPIDDALAAEIDALGPVAHVVAPSLYHHVFVPRTLARYPRALLSAAPGLADKRAGLPVADELDGEPSPAWQGSIDQVVIGGVPRMNEVAFFHRPSRTLIVTDLVFNVREPRGWGTALVLRTMGTYKRLGQSRLWGWLAKDRAALRSSVERVMAWDFTRVLPGHGEPVETDARAAMTQALWVLR